MCLGDLDLLQDEFEIVLDELTMTLLLRTGSARIAALAYIAVTEALFSSTYMLDGSLGQSREVRIG